MAHRELVPEGTLLAALHGDLTAIRELRRWPHDAIRQAAAATTLTVTRLDVAHVLRQFDEGAAEEDVRAWANFVRWGLFSGQAGDPIRPLDIEFEAEFEEEIVDVVARLDELGDEVDGSIAPPERRALIERMERRGRA